MKIVIVLLFICYMSALVANPILPVVISEIYFEGDDWTLELYGLVGFGQENLNDVQLVSNAGTSYFNDNILPNENGVFVVTCQNLQDSLYIDKTGDTIWFVDIGDEITYGEGTGVNAPCEGQSLARACFWEMGEFMSEEYYVLVKENSPTLGFSPFSVTTKGIINGYVYDVHGKAVENAELIHYPGNYDELIVTDENGFYEDDNVYGKNYKLKVWINDVEYGEQDITVEPDSTTTVDFYTSYDPVSVDTPISVADQVISNYPNPFNPQTTISFTAQNAQYAEIEIYNAKGQKVDGFYFNGSMLQAENSFTWNAAGQSSGVYFYKLIVDGKEIESKKMILLK